MADSRKLVNEEAGISLCATCVNARLIQSDRASQFYFCGLSATDAKFTKYPRLPVLSCSGYVKKAT